ncbi:MAG TPA: T9SS type A sorting domain-containing protein, partial [Phaeodactylibacter sp.]|nr:T9SS type A sorting domain-containing protein [Phaeodactylibacter sp.]
PTTAEGVNSGNVKYADAMEWDFSGEHVLFDAFNQIPKEDGTDIEFWDIGFLKAWDNASNDFGDGTIAKLIPQLPEGTSIGNPTFSKNSPYILAFDFRDADNNYFILGANIEKNDINTIFESNTWGYPNYARLDDKVVFDFLNNGTDQILATINLQSDKITGDPNSAVGILNTAKWGVWFAPGNRDFNTATEESSLLDENLKVFPNPFDNNINIELTSNFGNDLNISIFNMLGQKVFQQNIDISGNTYNATINLANLLPGNYLLQISNGNLLTNRKLLKLSN